VATESWSGRADLVHRCCHHSRQERHDGRLGSLPNPSRPRRTDAILNTAPHATGSPVLAQCCLPHPAHQCHGQGQEGSGRHTTPALLHTRPNMSSTWTRPYSSTGPGSGIKGVYGGGGGIGVGRAPATPAPRPRTMRAITLRPPITSPSAARLHSFTGHLFLATRKLSTASGSAHPPARTGSLSMAALLGPGRCCCERMTRPRAMPYCSSGSRYCLGACTPDRPAATNHRKPFNAAQSAAPHEWGQLLAKPVALPS
jgi:hypothetical protein